MSRKPRKPAAPRSMRFFLLMLLLGTLLPVILMRAGIYFRWLESQYQKESQANLEMARAAGMAFHAYINDIARQEMAIGSALVLLEPPQTPEATRFLVRSAAQYPSVRGFHWVDLQGTILNSSNPNYPGLSIQDRWHFQQALKSDSWVISDLIESRLDGISLVVIAQAIRDDTGQPRGVITAAIDVSRLQHDILNMGRSPGSMLDIIDRQGRIVAANPEMNLAWDQRVVRDGGLLSKALAGEPAVGLTDVNVLKGRWAIARVPISQSGFVASAGRSADEVLAPLRYDIIATGLTFLLIIAGAVIVALWISRRINRGLRRLQEHAAALAAGDLDHRAEVTGILELQALAEAFNRSADSRKQAETALRQNEERFRYATEAMAGFIYDVDLAAGTVQYSGGIAELLGFRLEGPVPMDWSRNHLHPDDLPAFDRNLSEILAGTRDFYNCEYRVSHPDGHIVWIADRGQAIRDASGRPARIVGGVAGICERKQAEQALRESEARLNALIESLPFDVWACDQTGRYILINSICRRRWGDLRGMRPEDVGVPPDTLALWKSNNSRALAGEEVRGEAEYVIDGEPLTFFNILAPIRDGSEIRGLVGVNIDITELKRAEQGLRESEGKFRSLAENCQAIIGIVQGRRYLYANPYLSQISGYSREELMSIDIADMIHPAFRQVVLERARLRQQGLPAPSHYEFLMLTKSGQERWIDLSPTAITYRGQPAVVGVAYDITDRKRAEQQLKELNETLEQRVVERTAVAEYRAAQLRAMAAELIRTEERERRRLAQMLHDDLQQLLAATKFHAGVLQNRLPSDAMRDRLRLMVDLLDQSIKASRTLTTELSPPILYDAGLAPAMTWLGRWMQTRHGLQVTVKADEKVDPLDEQVRVFLFQAIRELLFNVVKHAGVEQAGVEVERRDELIRVVVSDKGAGFSAAGAGPADTPSAAGHDGARGAEGAGRFGLFSIRERIEWLGGWMEIDSSPGSGTRVTLWAPVTATADKATGHNDTVTRRHGDTETRG